MKYHVYHARILLFIYQIALKLRKLPKLDMSRSLCDLHTKCFLFHRNLIVQLRKKCPVTLKKKSNTVSIKHIVRIASIKFKY